MTDPPPSSTAGRMPDFLVIGAQKAGTSAFARHLATHPGIHVPGAGDQWKELHYFDRDPLYQRGEAFYRQHFAGAADDQICGEATPNYLYSAVALDRIAADLPDVRLVAILRNPVDRAYAQYWMQRRYSGLAGPFSSTLDDASEVVGRSRYAEQLARVHARFRADQLLVLVYEEVFGCPAERADTWSRVATFLGVDDRFAAADVARVYEGRGEPPRASRLLVAGGQRVARAARAVTRGHPRVDQALHARGRIVRDRIGRVGGSRSYPPLTGPDRERARALLRDDVARLGQLLGGVPAAWHGDFPPPAGP